MHQERFLLRLLRVPFAPTGASSPNADGLHGNVRNWEGWGRSQAETWS